MKDELKFYQLSGKANIMGPLLGISLGTAIGIPLSFLYAYGIYHNPAIYLNFLISFAFAFFVCVAYSIGEKLGHNRNRFLSLLGALLMTILALYMAWVAFFFVLSKGELLYLKLLVNPMDVLTYIYRITEEGWIALGSSKAKTKGIVYILLLVAESLVYLWLFVVAGVLDETSVYCEECCKWLEPVLMPSILSDKLEKEMKETAEMGTIHWLDHLELTSSPPCITLTLTHCDLCNRLSTLTANKIDIVETEDEGEKKIENQESNIFQNLLITNETKEKILKKLENLEQEKFETHC